MSDLVKNKNELITQDVIDSFAIQFSNEMFSIGELGEQAIRDKINSVIDFLKNLKDKGDLIELDWDAITTHIFAPQVYIREVHIPKDQIIVGKIHRFEHFNYISKGRVTVLTKDGAAHYVAPCRMISTAGTQRLLYTHEDTIWTVIHPNPTDTHDLEKIEEFHICKDFSEFHLLENNVEKVGV
jgi:hypothetical protein